MDTIVEEPEPPADSSGGLSSKAAEVVHQVEQHLQAALNTVSASDKLDLVTKLTDYVSEALSEGSLTDNDLQRIFQVTTRLGEQLPDSLSESIGIASLSPAVSSQQAADLHRRTTSELLDWADDVPVVEAPPGSDTVNMNALASWSDQQSSVDLLDGLEKIAERSLSSPLTSEQAAAKALLNAARHSRMKAPHNADSSKYLNGVDANGMLVVPAPTDTSAKWMTGNRETFAARETTSHQGNVSGRHQQAKVTTRAPVFQRLYQLSETWRAHKAQLKEVQDDRDARAASPTPPVRLSSHARQRAADRLYAHAVQRRARQQAARQAQEQETSRSHSVSPQSHTFGRHAPDFFQRQQDLLARRQLLAEQQRPQDEESLQHCTGRPAISAFAHSLRRSTADLLSWQANKDEKMRRMRNQQAEDADAELTLIPRINRNSRQMALSLASRAAEQAPHLLAVIQSQPQGWVLADKPATARRPAMPGAARPKQQVAPATLAWVHATASTSMRLVQTGRDHAAHSHASSHLDAQTSASESVHGVSVQQAPWLGHGGVRNMDAGHIEATHKGQKPTHAASPKQAPARISTPANISGKHAHALKTRPTAASHSSLLSLRLAETDARFADTHPPLKSSQPSQQATFPDRVHAVDPIEAFAPAVVLERVSHTAESGSRGGPSAGAKPEGPYASLADSDGRASGIAEINVQSDHSTMQESNAQAFAQSEWTGFAEDDSTADDVELTFDTAANCQAADSLLGDDINAVQRTENQDSSGAALTAADWDDSAQAVRQQAGSEMSAKVQHLQPSYHVPSAKPAEEPTAPVSVDDTVSEEALSASGDQDRAAAPAAAHASKDRQSLVSKSPAQQSGIVSARRALQAMALKAAAEAAYKVSPSTVSSGSQRRQVALRRMSSSARRSDASWTPQLPPSEEQTGSVMSMHSVLKQKPKPLVPRIKLNAKAYQAAIQQSSGFLSIPVNSHGYAYYEGMRRRSSQEVSDQMITANQKGSARLSQGVYADKSTNGLHSSNKKPVKI